MSYLVHSDIVDSGAIRQRCSAAAALEGQDAPQSWVNASMWNIPNPDWTDAWAAAEAASPGADHGSDESVVTDPMILQGVQKERSRENPQPWSQPSIAKPWRRATPCAWSRPWGTPATSR